MTATMPPPIHATFGQDSPRVRRTDPSTSHEAADTSNVNASIGAVLDTLRQYGAKSDEQLHNLMVALGYPYTPERIRTARAALVGKGLVAHRPDLHAVTSHGRRTQVWGPIGEDN